MFKTHIRPADLNREENVENRGIDPRTSRMLSARSTIWASSPLRVMENYFYNIKHLEFANHFEYDCWEEPEPDWLWYTNLLNKSAL